MYTPIDDMFFRHVLKLTLRFCPKSLASIHLGCQTIFRVPLEIDLPTQIDHAKIENQSQNAYYGRNDHITDNQIGENGIEKKKTQKFRQSDNLAKTK